MGRKRTKEMIERAKLVYSVLMENKDRDIPTKDLLFRIIKIDPAIDYSMLYQALRILRDKGFIMQKYRGKVSCWTIAKEASVSELEMKLS